MTHHVDYTFMFVLAVFLTVKYIFFDDHIEEELHRKLEEAKQTRIRQISNSLRDNTTQTTDELNTCNITKPQDDIGKFLFLTLNEMLQAIVITFLQTLFVNFFILYSCINPLNHFIERFVGIFLLMLINTDYVFYVHQTSMIGLNEKQKNTCCT